MASNRQTIPPRARRRRVGRPSGDDNDLRARLLDAAIARFAREGIGATSLRAVAADAQVTPAMLHYYFGDKAQLTRALLDERLVPALAPMRARLDQVGDDPATLVAGFVAGIAEIVRKHPWLPALWVREVLCEGGELREALFDKAIPQFPQMLAQRFAAAQKDGRLNPAIDPRLLVVSLVGLTLFPAAGAPIWKRAFGAHDLDANALSAHTLALLDGGVQPPRTRRKSNAIRK
ncbi:MAG: TetR/AcrR family transcriptional regulator [Rudaea sp.]